jgi:hypothetical protein
MMGASRIMAWNGGAPKGLEFGELEKGIQPVPTA